MVGHVRFPADVEANYVMVSEDAHRWKCLLEDGKFWSAAEIADAEAFRSFVNRRSADHCWRQIQEAMPDGRQPKGMQLEDLTPVMPSGWNQQRVSAAIDRSV